jgi:hypothetical protein
MRFALKNTIAASLAALTIGVTLVGATPASAHWHPGGHHGFWGPGIAFGVLGLAAGGIAASAAEDNCIEHRPVYDRYGNFMGRQPVNVCQ